jgi:hypothetical protein
MIRVHHLVLASALSLSACAHHPPVPTPKQAEAPIRLYDPGTPAPAGTRFVIQFNDEPAILQIADGRGGPPILYHGKELNPDILKSVRILSTKEARERFGDQTLVAAILIELK